eukprot:gnl/Dysnectes_brevis/2181_a2540_2175.p1 GENE.gnl/Dysnectes_brevis/2181_a2540_2175~~gnl/Dysnectes_brevis/2181_a2540_2175.p1  ORF type:complete len:459 (+),score=155.06 gnl/Dysnectes_brevis/2181_a2540_2175:90-1466(+)
MALLDDGDLSLSQGESIDSQLDTIDSEPKIAQGNSSVYSSIFNLSNTIVGSGVLTIPFDLQCTGYGLGMAGLIFVACCSLFSFYMLSFASKRTGLFSYRDIGAALFGPRAGLLVELLVVVYTTGSCCSYPIIMRDNMFWWDPSDPTQHTYTIICMWIVVALIVFPLALLPKLDFLRFTSLAALLSVLYIVFVIIVFYLEVNVFGTVVLDPAPGPPQAINSDLVSVFTAFPLLGVAFTAHYNCLNVYAELKERSLARMNKVIGGTGSIIIVLYSAMGMFGYLTFTDLTQDDILKNFAQLPNPSLYVNFANICMLFTIIFSFPMVSFALRKSLLSLVFPKKHTQLEEGAAEGAGEDGELLVGPSASKRDTRRRIIFTVIIVLTASTVASLVDSISTVLSFSSSIAGTSIVYIFPGLFYYKLLRRTQKLQRTLAIVMVGVGFFFMVTGLGSWVLSTLTGSE